MPNAALIFQLLLALPALPMLWALANGEYAAELLHASGETSARLLLVALMLTPLRLLFPTARWLAWLRGQRRALGVAAFAYAALHTVLYLIDMETLTNVLAEFTALGIWTGWLAFVIFVPLALTSTRWAVRRLGTRWQWLHRSVYVAAVASLVHWLTIHDNAVSALIHFTPLMILEVYRVWTILRRAH